MTDNNVTLVGNEVYHAQEDQPLDTFLEWLIFFSAYLFSGEAEAPLTGGMSAQESHDTFLQGLFKTVDTFHSSYTKDNVTFHAKLDYLLDNMDQSTEAYAFINHVNMILTVYIVSETLTDKTQQLLDRMNPELDATLVSTPLRSNKSLTVAETNELIKAIETDDSLSIYSPALLTSWKDTVSNEYVSTTADITAEFLYSLEPDLLAQSRSLSNSYNVMWKDLLDVTYEETTVDHLDLIKAQMLTDDVQATVLKTVFQLCTIVNDFAQNTGIRDRDLKVKLTLLNLDLRKSVDTLTRSLEIVQVSEALKNQQQLTAYESTLDNSTAVLVEHTETLGLMILETDLTPDNSLAIQTDVLVNVNQASQRAADVAVHTDSVKNAGAFVASSISSLKGIDPQGKDALETSMTHLMVQTHETGHHYENVSGKQESTVSALTNFINIQDTAASIKDSAYWTRILTAISQAEAAKKVIGEALCTLRATLGELTCLIGIGNGYVAQLDEIKTDAEKLAERKAKADAAKSGATDTVSAEFGSNLKKTSKANVRKGVEAAAPAIEAAFPDNPEVYALVMEAALAASDSANSSQPTNLLDAAKSTFDQNVESLSLCVDGNVEDLFKPLDSNCELTGNAKKSGHGLSIPKKDLSFKLRVDGSVKC